MGRGRPTARRPPNFTGLDFQIDEAATLAGYLAAGFSTEQEARHVRRPAVPGRDAVHGRHVRRYPRSTTRSTARPSSSSAGTRPSRPARSSAATTPGVTPPRASSWPRRSSTRAPTSSSPVAGATGNGTIKAMLAAGKWAIGVDTDQAISLAEYAPAILTSAQKVIDVAVLDTIKKNSGGDLGGENYVGTLANNGVALAPFHDLDSKIPPDSGPRWISSRRTSPPAPSRSPTTSSSRTTARDRPRRPSPVPGGGRLGIRRVGLVHAARAQGHHQALPGRARQRPDLDLGRPRRGAGPARRERGRQDHADEHPVGPVPAGLGRDPDRRRAADVRRPARRRSTPASAWSTSTSSSSPCSTSSRPSRSGAESVTGLLGAFDRKTARQRVVELSEQYGLNVDPDADDRGPAGRRPPAGRDPQGAVPQERHPRPRRAVGGADAGRDRGAVRRSSAASPRPARRSSSSPTSSTRCSRSRTGSRSCAAVASPAPSTPKTTTREQLAEPHGRPRRGAAASTRARPSPARSSSSLAGRRTSATIASSMAVKGVSLEVRAGEIVAIAGVQGNGQTELVEAIVGLRTIDSGDDHGRRRRTSRRPRRARSRTWASAHIPEDRMRDGLIADMTVAENYILDPYHREPYSSRRPPESADAIDDGAGDGVKDFDIRTPSISNDGGLAVRRQPAEGRSSRASSRGPSSWSSRPSRPAAWTSARSSTSTSGSSSSATPARPS